MSSSPTNPLWNGVVSAVVPFAGVGVFALWRDAGFHFWIWAAPMCVVGGIFSAVSQARRNQRLDRMVKQAHEWDSRSEAEQTAH
ncbi:hypothetical protein [Actinoplanes palleronii]|nr:hypothetical protein [Actinoplanes palleronii]